MFRRIRSRGLLTLLLLALALTGAVAAADFPRGTLWRVEQTCMLDARTTGSPFPCLAVNLDKGFVLLRAPFRQTHLVLMPAERVTGIEDPLLRGPIGAVLFGEAWTARRLVEAEAMRPLAWADIGLAVNSRYTRSQDQLHIHVDCVRASVRRDIAARLASLPTDRWEPDGFVFQGQSYWARRTPRASLDGLNIPRLIDEIPALKARPREAIVAVLGTAPQPGQEGQDGFVLLAGASDPSRMAHQSTSEDLLDHKCRAGS